MNESRDAIAVECPDAMERYQHKKVLFSVMFRDGLVQYVGEFYIQSDPARVSIRIDPDLFGTAHSRETIHLSQKAVDSIQSIENAEYQFVVTAQLDRCLFRHDRG